MSLYPDYRPIGIRKNWDCTSISLDDAHLCLQRHCAPHSLGRPIDAIAWWEDETGHLRCVVADFANGRRADLRISKRGFRLSLTTPARGEEQ